MSMRLGRRDLLIGLLLVLFISRAALTIRSSAGSAAKPAAELRKSWAERKAVFEKVYGPSAASVLKRAEFYERLDGEGEQ